MCLLRGADAQGYQGITVHGTHYDVRQRAFIQQCLLTVLMQPVVGIAGAIDAIMLLLLPHMVCALHI